jgi:hypothetical protein
MTAQTSFQTSLTQFKKAMAQPFRAVIALCAVLFFAPSFSQTQLTSPTVKLDAANPKQTGVVKPGWSKLTPAQQKALQPLAHSWDTLSGGQQRKWLEVSRNYPSLPPEDKASMHSRMAEWAALSTRERAEARLNFASTKELAQELTADEKKAKWEAYQSLSSAEKKILADKGSRPPTGAATAVQPVAQKKLATLPAPTPPPNKPPKISESLSVSDNSAAATH